LERQELEIQKVISWQTINWMEFKIRVLDRTFLGVHIEIHHIGDDLEVALWLHEAAHDPK
jgi:hypothetical protein